MYTYAKTHGNKILLSLIDENKKLRFETKEFRPELFVDSIEESEEFNTFIGNNPVSKITFDNIKELQKGDLCI